MAVLRPEIPPHEPWRFARRLSMTATRWSLKPCLGHCGASAPGILRLPGVSSISKENESLAWLCAKWPESLRLAGRTDVNTIGQEREHVLPLNRQRKIEADRRNSDTPRGGIERPRSAPKCHKSILSLLANSSCLLRRHSRTFSMLSDDQ